MIRVLVTGASGFVGRALCSAFLEQGLKVRAAVRSVVSMPLIPGLEIATIGEVCENTDWSTALQGVDCVVHCAARTHVMRETVDDALAAYRAVNVAGTICLAEQAAALNVRRLIFVSSIKVNGEQTGAGAPFCVDGLSWDSIAHGNKMNPLDPYGLSKLEAEQALWIISGRTGLEVVVVRPPMVYGPGVKGNMLSLLRWVVSGVPIPLGAVDNKRSMIGLCNLADLLLRCVEHPGATGRTFLASDGQDISTPQIIRLMAQGINRPVHLLSVPVSLLQAGGWLLGRRDEIDRLTGSLQIDSAVTQSQLDWSPPVSVDDGVRQMAKWYADNRYALAAL